MIVKVANKNNIFNINDHILLKFSLIKAYFNPA